MPELPDVEGFRRVLARHAVGKPVRRVEVRDRGVLRGTSAPQLARARVNGRMTVWCARCQPIVKGMARA